MMAGGWLRAEIDLAFPALRDATARFWASPDLPERYPLYLAALHGTIRATVPLIDAALAESLRRPDDPVACRLAGYLTEQREQELGHDAWLLGDYAALGRDPADLLEPAPGPDIAVLVGAQYYWVLHVHPVALLGHIAVLEQRPPPPDVAERLAVRTGLPLDAFRTLAAHAELDADHGAALDALLDVLPLEQQRRSLVGMSALQTVTGLVALFARLTAAAVPVDSGTR
ncbi:MAG TPA: iron-containing redox enzyme family protein [Streptosporangiaceae bacterium]|jgi:hypothetical protein